MKKNPFGHILFFKKILFFIFGGISYKRFRGFNDLQIEGSEVIRRLPGNNVLFVSNHQTYFADVAAMFHVFNASLKGRDNTLKNWGYLFKGKMNVYYIAAKETMSAGWLPRVMSYMGAIPVERTWRANGEEVQRTVNSRDTDNISVALKDGWVITFPQGTTTAFTPIRKGTAHIIKNNKPVVVPIVIDGFRRSFDKKGLFLKKKGILQSMVIKKPLEIDYENESIEDIVEKIELAIEQHPSNLKVLSVEEVQAQEELNKLREW